MDIINQNQLFCIFFQPQLLSLQLHLLQREYPVEETPLREGEQLKLQPQMNSTMWRMPIQLVSKLN